MVEHEGVRIKPLGPQEITEARKQAFPNEVIESVNELLMENDYGGSICLRQSEITERMVQKGLTVQDIYAKGWLNFEGIYAEAGWKVYYDRPGYNESYEPSFNFSRRKENS